MAAMFVNSVNSGFYRTPVTKALLGCLVVGTCAIHFPIFFSYKKYLVWSLSLIVERREVWRLISSKLVFLEVKDLVCGSLLLFYLRIFERRYGSQKFCSYLIATCGLSSLLEVAAMYVLREYVELPFEVDTLPAGPFGMVFALFVPYFSDIPRVAYTSIMGIPVTGKSLTYLLAFQLMSSSPETIISGMCGLVTGVLYRYNFLWVKDVIRVPDVVGQVFKRTVGRLLETSAPADWDAPTGATLEAQRQMHMEQLEQQMLFNSMRGLQQGHHAAAAGAPYNQMRDGGQLGGSNLMHRRNLNHNAEAIRPNPVALSEDQVQLLVDMGFDRSRVEQALRSSNNDVSIATNILLQDS